MTKDEVLKLALEFIENSECGTADLEARIKKALAQPEQDSVAMADYMALMEKYAFLKAQRTWVGLTAGEILDTLISVDEKTVRLPAMLGQFACAIEAKLKEKNT